MLRRVISARIRIVLARAAIDQGLDVRRVSDLVDVVVGVISLPLGAAVVPQLHLWIERKYCKDEGGDEAKTPAELHKRIDRLA